MRTRPSRRVPRPGPRVRAAAGAIILAGGVLVPASPAVAEEGLDQAEYAEFQSAVAGYLDDYWSTLAVEREVAYETPGHILTGSGEAVLSECGAVSADPGEVAIENVVVSPAFYCPADGTIYLSVGWTYREIYTAYGDFAAAVVLAHEWAHHTQIVSGTTNRGTKESELQADCWAGTWGRDVDKRGLLEPGDLVEAGAALHAMGDYEYGAPDHHGTPKERLAWFVHGYEGGDPADCNPSD